MIENESPKKGDREKAVEAYLILNEFIGDLVLGTSALDFLSVSRLPPFSDEQFYIGATRMCVGHIVLTLSKWAEFYEHFRKILPEEVRAACRELRKEIAKRRICDYRNKVVGHIWDKNQKRHLANDEVDRLLQEIYCGDFEEFLSWINNPKGNSYPETVVAITQYVRDCIKAKHNLGEVELFP
jgi:hypothetical protein